MKRLLARNKRLNEERTRSVPQDEHRLRASRLHSSGALTLASVPSGELPFVNGTIAHSFDAFLRPTHEPWTYGSPESSSEHIREHLLRHRREHQQGALRAEPATRDLSEISTGSLKNSSTPSVCAQTLGASSQAGYTSAGYRKRNQDAYFTKQVVGGSSSTTVSSPAGVLLGVFDGHGEDGTAIANTASEVFGEAFSRSMGDRGLYELSTCGSTNTKSALRMERTALSAAFRSSERAAESAGADHMFSGSTGIVAWVPSCGSRVVIANVGDSRCIAAVGPSISMCHAVDISSDQCATRPDEKRRVCAAGARVVAFHGARECAADSRGLRKTQGDTNSSGLETCAEPERLYLPHKWMPGLAMTRSIGDTVLRDYGVDATAEVTALLDTRDAQFLVVCSDGVTEFITSERVVRIVSEQLAAGSSPQAAVERLVQLAEIEWRARESNVDDITAIVYILPHGQDDREAPSLHQDQQGALSRKFLSLGRKVRRSNIVGVTAECKPMLIQTNGRCSTFRPG